MNVKYKWGIAAIIYLVIVFAVTIAFLDQYSPNHDEHQAGEPHSDEAEHGKDEAEHGDDHANGHQDGKEEADDHDHANGTDDDHDHGDHVHHRDGKSEVKPVIEYDGTEMFVTFVNLAGDPVTELQMTHEKYVHLIIVSADLEQFKHYHPEQVGPGQFKDNIVLEEGTYYLFADIKPAGYHYFAEPIEIQVGDAVTGSPNLVEDMAAQTIDQYTVSLQADHIHAGHHVELIFDIEGGTPEPYLGALGHVVILDEAVEEYIHVHPTSKDDTVFDAYFPTPGKYKLWVEFKLDGEVHVFSFVLDVK